MLVEELVLSKQALIRTNMKEDCSSVEKVLLGMVGKMNFQWLIKQI
jgi:hypothetical protein